MVSHLHYHENNQFGKFTVTTAYSTTDITVIIEGVK